MIFRLASRNVFRNKRRSFLTTVMVSVAIALMVVLQGLVDGSEASIIESTTKYETGDIKILPRNSIDASLGSLSLLNKTDEIQAILAEIEYVQAFSPRIKMSSAIVVRSVIQGVVLVAVDPAYERSTTVIVSQIVNGTYFDGEDSLVLGQALAESLRIKMNEKIALLLPNGIQRNFTISGMFSTGITDFDEKFVYVKLDAIRAILGLNENQASEIMVVLKDSGTVDKSAADIASRLRQESIECDVKTWKDLSQSLLLAIELNRQVIGIIYLIALVIAGTGIMNTMFMSVSERTREIGILQAIGAKPLEILQIFLLESLIIGATGGALGCVFGTATGYAINFAGFELPKQVQVFSIIRIQVVVAPLTVFSTFAFAMATSLVAGVYPAWRASRREPMEALRYV